MGRNIISPCSGLRLLTCDDVLRFANINSTTVIAPKAAPVIVNEIPGTLYVQHSYENGIYTKNITFEYSGVSPETSNLFEALRHLKFIALYTDETGRERVCGSKTYPLSLEYTTSEGAFLVVLRGEDTHADTFLFR